MLCPRGDTLHTHTAHVIRLISRDGRRSRLVRASSDLSPSVRNVRTRVTGCQRTGYRTLAGDGTPDCPAPGLMEALTYVAVRYTRRLAEAGAAASVGSTGDG